MKIILESVSKVYKQKGSSSLVLKNTNAIFEQNKSYAVCGVSGSGKSTLLHILAGLETDFFGKITFSFQQKEFTPSFGVIFQNDYLIEQLSCFENIAIASIIKGIALGQVKQKVYSILKRIGLEQKANSYPYQLSGGQRTRVAIARAVVVDPTFIIAVEPTSNLDRENSDIIIELLLELKQELKIGLIIGTHDLTLASKMDFTYKIEGEQLLKV